MAREWREKPCEEWPHTHGPSCECTSCGWHILDVHDSHTCPNGHPRADEYEKYDKQVVKASPDWWRRA